LRQSKTLGGRLKQLKAQPPKSDLCKLIVLRGSLFDLLEDCSGLVELQFEVKTHPADAAKEA
jgi:hypothetical protein